MNTEEEIRAIGRKVLSSVVNRFAKLDTSLLAVLAQKERAQCEHNFPVGSLCKVMLFFSPEHCPWLEMRVVSYTDNRVLVSHTKTELFYTVPFSALTPIK